MRARPIRGRARSERGELDRRSSYTYTTEVLDQEGRSGDRYLVTARLTGDFPGETVDLRCDFAVTSDLISRLMIAP